MSLLTDHDPYKKHIEASIEPNKYASGAYSLIAATKPTLDDLTGVTQDSERLTLTANPKQLVAYPVGISQNFNLGFNRPFMKIWEIGSERPYHISGRTMGQINIGRIYYNGPSLLRVLYATYKDTGHGITNLTGVEAAEDLSTTLPAGAGQFIINLASDWFARPTGILVLIKNNERKTLAATFFESCYIPSYNMGMDGNQTLITEGSVLMFDRALPITMGSQSNA